MKWIECQSCFNEFRVVSDFDGPIEFCPYCGADIEEDAKADYDEDEDQY